MAIGVSVVNLKYRDSYVTHWSLLHQTHSLVNGSKMEQQQISWVFDSKVEVMRWNEECLLAMFKCTHWHGPVYKMKREDDTYTWSLLACYCVLYFASADPTYRAKILVAVHISTRPSVLERSARWSWLLCCLCLRCTPGGPRGPKTGSNERMEVASALCMYPSTFLNVSSL